ncbi:MAG: hypothetical protein ACI8TQ_002055 [Planctomycetota bacterium]|jgi:hypothetical protein
MLPLLLALLITDPDPTPTPTKATSDPVVEEEDDWILDLTDNWSLIVGPKKGFYPSYLASQHRATFALKSISNFDSEIEGAGESRFGLRIGAKIGLFHLVPKSNPYGGVLIDGEVGFLAQFDRDNSTDNLGWDGLYAMHANWMSADKLALRFGFAHDSSHLGDEFIESNGRKRINYTREELRVGASMQLSSEWRGYAEYGHAYTINNPALQERGRFEWGFEFESIASPWNGRSKPFAAFDVTSYEEDDWKANVTLQLGVVSQSSSSTIWRVGLEYYDGRSPIGELFQDEERHLAWGFWFDV